MTRAMHLGAAAAAACLASALAGQTPLTAVRVASGLSEPLFAASPPGDEDRLFLVEQSTDSITSFGEDARGELYICDQDGDVFRIVANAPPAAIDLGFGKVGGNGLVPKFELCGLLGAGQSAQAILRRAPASTTAALLLSGSLRPLVLPIGTIAPGAPIFSVPFVTSAEGRVQFTLLGGLGPITLYMQWAMLDGGATAGPGLSNALGVVWP